MSLKDAINLASSAAPKISTLAVYTNLAIHSDGQKISFIGAGMDLGINTNVEYAASQFSCCVEAARLRQAIAIMPEPTFKLESDNRLLIKQGRQRAIIPILDYGMHPGLPQFDKDAITVQGSVLALVDRVQFAAAKKDVRYYLTGVHIMADGNDIYAVATNTHRIAIAKQAASLKPFGCIVPATGLRTMIGLNPTELAIGKAISCRTSDGTNMVIKMIDATYPDFRRVVPNNLPHQLSCSTEDLLRAIRSVRAFANEQTQGITLSWTTDAMTITASNPQGAESVAELDCDASKEGEIGLNGQYIEEAIASLKDKEAFIQFGNSKNDSIRIDEGNYTQVVMPMRI